MFTQLRIPGAIRYSEVVGLERSSPSFMSTIEEVLERKSCGFGLENRDYGHRGSATLTTHVPLYPQTLALTSPTSCGRSVGIVRSRTWATEFGLKTRFLINGYQLRVQCRGFELSSPIYKLSLQTDMLCREI
jgi:hypothetical protein